jgi:hypothetical protein
MPDLRGRLSVWRRFTVCGVCHEVVEADRPRGEWTVCEHGPHADPIDLVSACELLGDEAVRRAAEAMEDAAVRWLGRDLGTARRDDIARAALEAALASPVGASQHRTPSRGRNEA